ncbi:hypothetical protein GCM10027093_11460 [Paraburkholderia jirisanensis]
MSGDVGVRSGCGSCAQEYDKGGGGVNPKFASDRSDRMREIGCAGKGIRIELVFGQAMMLRKVALR